MIQQPYRGAIVGFGQVAEHGHWPAYAASADFRIVAVVERTAARRDAARAIDPAVHAVTTLDELGHDEIDFVDICTPPALHGDPMLAAIGRGWHVVCEKPFVLDLETFARIRAAAVGMRRAVIPVHNWKYAPIVRRATTLVREGVIGAVREVSIETLRLKDAATADPDRPNWRRDPAVAGGGILMDHGWHAIYLAMHWFGAKPTAAAASLHHPAGGGVEDEARVVLRFGPGHADIHLSWNAEVRRNTIVLRGEAGEIVAADRVLQIRAGGADGEIPFASALSAGSHHADWFAGFLPDVRRAFDDPDASRPLLDEAGACLWTVQHAYAAAAAAEASS